MWLSLPRSEVKPRVDGALDRREDAMRRLLMVAGLAVAMVLPAATPASAHHGGPVHLNVCVGSPDDCGARDYFPRR